MKTLKIFIALFFFTVTNTGYSDNLITQSQLNEISADNYKSSDYMLNLAYSKLFTFLDNERKEKLKLSQRAWIKFRDLEADLISSEYSGGSIRPLIHHKALRDITERRTSELTRLYLEVSAPQER